MTNRVILGNYDGTPRLRISRPTYNVTTMTLDAKYIAFDSAWVDAANIYSTGTFTMQGSESIATINFGKTFPFIPVVMVLKLIPMSASATPDNDYVYWLTDTPLVYRDRFVMSNLPNLFFTGSTATVLSYRYFVFTTPMVQ